MSISMPLTSDSPTYLHVLQNLSLVGLALLFTPFCTIIAVISSFISPFTAGARHIRRRHGWRATSSDTFRPRIVLITGVGMSKGLFIARSFYKDGHIVIGADFEPYGVSVCGRFSKALKRFYTLPKPSPEKGSTLYLSKLIEIIERERVELWVSCSSVASAVEDGEAAEAVERWTSCRVIQFDASLTEILHEKHSFIENAEKLGLNVPDTHVITSINDAMQILHPSPQLNESRSVKKSHIMKSIGLDDSIRADLTLLPKESTEDTRIYISRLQPSPIRPFVLQQFIRGSEYCTHSIVVQGKVLAFTCCESAELLMHYKALSPTSDLSKAMLSYTQIYAEEMGQKMTGHFSIDFMLDESSQESDLMKKIYPIECNPRAHTAVVLFAGRSKEMVEAYLSVLEDYTPLLGEKAKETGTVTYCSVGYYWIGHDVVTYFIIPLWGLLTLKADLSFALKRIAKFFEHILFWKDGTFEVWDPWPAWWLYCGYWPRMFLMAIYMRDWWSRCNVSTTKMFRC